DPARPPRAQRRGRSRLVLGGNDVDELAAAARTELHDAVGGREQRVVAALADVESGVELGAALANDDRSRGDRLAAVTLHTQPLRVGVTTVAGGAGALLLRHGGSALRDSGDLDGRVVLPVAPVPAVVRLVLVRV